MIRASKLYRIHLCSIILQFMANHKLQWNKNESHGLSKWYPSIPRTQMARWRTKVERLVAFRFIERLASDSNRMIRKMSMFFLSVDLFDLDKTISHPNDLFLRSKRFNHSLFVGDVRLTHSFLFEWFVQCAFNRKVILGDDQKWKNFFLLMMSKQSFKFGDCAFDWRSYALTATVNGKWEKFMIFVWVPFAVLFVFTTHNHTSSHLTNVYTIWILWALSRMSNEQRHAHVPKSHPKKRNERIDFVCQCVTMNGCTVIIM